MKLIDYHGINSAGHNNTILAELYYCISAATINYLPYAIPDEVIIIFTW